MRHRTPHFAHVFSGDGYSSGYYSYLWSEVLDADAFMAFEETGDAFDPRHGGALEAFIYSAGNLRDPAEAYTAFRGKLADAGCASGQAGPSGSGHGVRQTGPRTGRITVSRLFTAAARRSGAGVRLERSRTSAAGSRRQQKGHSFRIPLERSRVQYRHRPCSSSPQPTAKRQRLTAQPRSRSRPESIFGALAGCRSRLEDSAWKMGFIGAVGKPLRLQAKAACGP